MKKGILTFGFAMIATFAMAQDSKSTAAPQKAATNLTIENMKFEAESHDFGTVKEGNPAEFVFKFKNTGKEPIIIQDVKPACSCTTPDWTKTPIMPGKTGTVTASYGTQGRPGAFSKSVTVISNAGTKTLMFNGTVEKAPSSSVPENNSAVHAH